MGRLPSSRTAVPVPVPSCSSASSKTRNTHQLLTLGTFPPPYGDIIILLPAAPSPLEGPKVVVLSTTALAPSGAVGANHLIWRSGGISTRCGHPNWLHLTHWNPGPWRTAKKLTMPATGGEGRAVKKDSMGEWWESSSIPCGVSLPCVVQGTQEEHLPWAQSNHLRRGRIGLYKKSRVTGGPM